jgi:hypothetical protein
LLALFSICQICGIDDFKFEVRLCLPLIDRDKLLAHWIAGILA